MEALFSCSEGNFESSQWVVSSFDSESTLNQIRFFLDKLCAFTSDYLLFASLYYLNECTHSTASYILEMIQIIVKSAWNVRFFFGNVSLNMTPDAILFRILVDLGESFKILLD